MVTIFLKVRNCSVPSQLRAKIPSPPAMGFLLVCLGIGLQLQANTSRDNGLLNSYKISVIHKENKHGWNFWSCIKKKLCI